MLHFQRGLIPKMFKYLNKEREEREAPRIGPWRMKPKQNNSNDCALFVMKYMDHILQGFDLRELRWTDADIETFRFRIARELQKGKCRGIPGFRMQQRIDQAFK